MAITSIEWSALVRACSAAAAIIADDEALVYADVSGEGEDQQICLKQFGESGEMYVLLRKKDNLWVAVSDSSVFATTVGGGEVQLSFLKTWVVGQDATLSGPAEDRDDLRNASFAEKWEALEPQLRRVVDFFREQASVLEKSPGGRVSSDFRIAFSALRKAMASLMSSHHLRLPSRSLCQAAAERVSTDVIIGRVKALLRHFNGDMPGVEASDADDTMYLLRVNAPAWYEDAAFLRWLNSDGVATWHTKGDTVAGEYADAFFTYGGRGDGSDSPCVEGENRTGLPTHIWEQVECLAAATHGWEEEILFWVSNEEPRYKAV